MAATRGRAMLQSRVQSDAAARGAAELRHVVYVIDDEPALRRISCQLIAALGITSVEYARGEDFLRDVEGLEPGCILLDVAMEPMNGLEVQRELRRRYIDWPVIFMSGALRIRASGGDAVEFLEKPFSDEDLMRALHLGFMSLRKGRS